MTDRSESTAEVPARPARKSSVPLAGVWSYLSRRLGWGAVVVLAVTLIVFVLFNLLPSADPATLRAGRNATPVQISEVRHSLGLDRSFLAQYGIFLWNLVAHFDLGASFEFGVPVSDLIRDRLPVSLALIAGAAVIWLGVGVGSGVLSAARPGSVLDRLSGLGSIFLISAPVFWLGYLALLLFAAGSGSFLPVLPGIGAYLEADTLPQKAAALILPWLVLGLSSAAIYLRMTRAVVREELSEPYATAARARGLPERKILWGHAARNGMGPLMALAGIDLGLILAGNAVLVEKVFNLPGVGSLLVTAIERSDLPLVEGIVLLSAVSVVLATIAADLLHAMMDPRVRR